MKKAALHNLGCKVNAYETECMAHLLEEDGYEIVDFADKADVYVVNTCTVTHIADRKSRQMLRRCRENNPEAIVVAAGCYVQTGEAEIKKSCNVDIIIANNRKEELVRLINEFEKGRKQIEELTEIDKEREYEDMFLYRTVDHTRAFIKVQDGCDQFCSYCLIPYARGRSRSRKIESALSEIGHLAEQGYKEVVLTGIHLDSFGKDTGESLLELIRRTGEIEGIERIRFGSFEPRVMNEEFIKGLSEISEVCPHFHLSLQSGSDTVLQRMNRKYTSAEYEESVRLLRKFFEDPAITTDVIVGFPGETDEEFEESYEFAKRIGFYEMHVFKFSKRKGTRAEKMPGQVPEEVKHERSRRLIELAEEMSTAFKGRYAGKTAGVLFEEEHPEGGLCGFTREYIKVRADLPIDKCGQILQGKLCVGDDKDGFRMI